MARYINIHTKEIVEEHITGCKCKSQYARLQDWKDLNSISLEELQSLVKPTKVIYKTVVVSEELKEQIELNSN